MLASSTTPVTSGDLFNGVIKSTVDGLVVASTSPMTSLPNVTVLVVNISVTAMLETFGILVTLLLVVNVSVTAKLETFWCPCDAIIRRQCIGYLNVGYIWHPL